MDVQTAAATVQAAFHAGVGIGVVAGVAGTVMAYVAIRWWQERRP